MVRAFCLCWIFMVGLVSAAFCQDGIKSDEILIGQSCALSGPAQALGRGVKAGMDAYFAKINAEGGVNGKKIRLISKDDGYEPIQAIRNTRELLDQDRVFLLIGEVGTPTSEAVLPLVEKAKVPFFGPFTGAEFLRNPFRKYVINVRASYYQEMEKLAEYLVDKKGLKKIACFYQNDAYGLTGLNGIRLALEKRSLQLAATGSYERNTLAVKSSLLAIRKATPDAIVMTGTYQPCAEFIRTARKIGMKETIFCNISFVGTDALLKEVGNDGEGCIISQVVSFPWDDSIALVKEYHDALKNYAPDSAPGFVSMEGYMTAKLFCMILSGLKDISRENFIREIETVKTFDLGGIVAQFDTSDHQGMNSVFLTIIKDGAIKPLDL